MPYVVQQRCLNKRKVRSAISATAGLLDTLNWVSQLLSLSLFLCFGMSLVAWIKINECKCGCASLVELLQGGTGGLSVLRTFRLLRILKLVRFLPALRYQLFVMLKTMDNVATFFALLVLFIFIFRYFNVFASSLKLTSSKCPLLATHQAAFSGLFSFTSYGHRFSWIFG